MMIRPCREATLRPCVIGGLSVLALAALPAQAQDLRNTAPPAVPPVPAAGTVAEPDPSATPSSDPIVLATLKGVVIVPDASPSSLSRLATGVDASAVPLVGSAVFTDYLQQAIGQPASLASLRGLTEGVSRRLRDQGAPFVSVWIPPQDLTDGVVRIVVRPARTEGPLTVVGAHYFSARSYLRWIRQQPGAAPDGAQLQEDIDWINRNPFRNATLAAEPGAEPDTTRLSLRVRERRPFRVFAGADNAGTVNTDDQRLFAGFNWGNAFGRGDQLSYQYRVDPSRKRSITHSGSYQTDLPWRNTLLLSAAWSKITPDLGPLFDQTGKSWQVGGQYRVPLATRRTSKAAIDQGFGLGLDFKYSDNNINFVSIPVTQNKTHVAEVTLSYTLSRETARDTTYLSPQLVLSPGGFSKYNRDAAFEGSRDDAPARYAYVRLDGEYTRRLPADLTWDVRVNMQYSSVPLLGSEQIAGTGAYAGRGYPESAAFGDSGVVLSNELHAPAMALHKPRDISVDAFVFHDAAWLHTVGSTRSRGASETLSSVGLGAALRWGSLVALNMAYAVPLKQDVGSENGSRLLFRLQVAY